MKRLFRTLRAMLRSGRTESGHVTPHAVGDDIPVRLAPVDAATELTQHDQDHGHYPNPPVRLRQGRRVPRHLYAQQGPHPSDTDPPVGMVDTPDLAARIVEAVNECADPDPEAERARIRDAILAEIDDHDPDGTMRTLMEEQQIGQGDPGHAGNAWWRAYCHIGGLMLALACIDEKPRPH